MMATTMTNLMSDDENFLVKHVRLGENCALLLVKLLSFVSIYTMGGLLVLLGNKITWYIERSHGVLPEIQGLYPYDTSSKMRPGQNYPWVKAG
jgi:hypothetical protein